MPFKKGKSGNPRGRPHVPNKITQEKREQLSKILDAGLKELPSVMKKIKDDKPEVYVKLMLDVASFIVPKKKDITSDDQPIQTLPITGVNIIKDEADEQTSTEAD